MERTPDVVWSGPCFGDPAGRARSLQDSTQAALARAHDLFILTNVAGETSLTEADDSDVASVLLRESRTWGADLMVLDTHGRSGIERVLLGSTVESFLRMAAIPVLIVPGRKEQEGRTQ